MVLIETKEPPMDAIKIKQVMLERQLTMAEIARGIGQKRESVSAVVHRKRTTPHIRRAIAKAIGMTYKEVWGTADPGVDRLPAGRPSKCVDSGTHSESDLPASPIENKVIAGGLD